jgi:flagellar assembly protein FliH
MNATVWPAAPQGAQTWNPPGARAFGALPPSVAALLLRQPPANDSGAPGATEAGQRQQAGYEAGLRQAREEMRPVAAALAAALADLAAPRRLLDEQVAAELHALALEASRRLLHEVLDEDSERLRYILEAVLEEFPLRGEAMTLRLNPLDAPVARALFAEQGLSVSVQEDAAVMRGGCLLSGGASTLDATVEARLHAL